MRLPPRHAHAGFVTGLCQLQARTTRHCWSYSTSDGRVCKWRTEELEPQLTAERAGLLQAEVEALSSQLSDQASERRAEQVRHTEESARDADALALSEAALEEARQQTQQLRAQQSEEKKQWHCSRHPLNGMHAKLNRWSQVSMSSIRHSLRGFMRVLERVI